MSAAKRKTLWLSLIASALVFCVPAVASSYSVLAPKTRAELKTTSGPNRVELVAVSLGTASSYYDRFGEVALESLVAPKGAVVLDDALEAGARNRVVLKDRIMAPGEFRNGDILLNRQAIREVADETGDSVRRVLYDTAYHEAVHKAIDPIARRVSKFFGVDDIYEASYLNMLDNGGWGLWYRAEEGLAETIGRFRGFLRDRWGIK